MGKRLARLETVFAEQPIFFITSCTARRQRILADRAVNEICREVWENAVDLYGWLVGGYVLMPDHVHFFCSPTTDGRSLELFVGKWKEWTAKYAHRRLGFKMPLWQSNFFDHVVRTDESYEAKWHYTRENPVRAGLVSSVLQWPYFGELNDFRDIR